MAMEWSNEKVLEFLEVLQNEPCLWNPQHKGYKNRGTQCNAWRRIKQTLPFPTTVEDLKKKKDSVMGYYRIHLNKYKKSLKSTDGGNEIYSTNWFAFEAMDSFLRPVYESKTGMLEDSMARERSDSENDGNSNSFNWSANYTEGENRHFQRENKTKDEFEHMECEYEMFGKLVAIKLQKIRNPNTREILMNDIHNLVSRACMMDHLEQQPSPSTYKPSRSPSLNKSPPSPSTSQSPSDPTTTK